MFPFLKCLVLLQDLGLLYVMLLPRNPSRAISENLYSPIGHKLFEIRSILLYFKSGFLVLIPEFRHHKFLENILLNVLMNLLFNKKMEYLHFLPV